MTNRLVMSDGVNKVYCGDCLEVMKLFSKECIDLSVTSPPYDTVRAYEGYAFDYKHTARELYRVTKNGGIVVWVVGDSTKNFCESLSSFKQAIYFVEKCGFNLLDTMIYEKRGGPSPYPNLRRYSPWFEYMFVFSKGRPATFNPIKDKPTKSGGGKLNSGNTARQRDGSMKGSGSYTTKKYTTRHNVWKYDVGKGKDTKDVVALAHPARFPEKLVHDHIVSWSNEGDTVLDPFAGSGTTLKVAKQTNRNYVGIEVSEKYCTIIQERLNAVEQNQKEKIQ